jgi:hypothetical protein
LHESTIEIAKVSKLLLAVDSGKAGELIGKSLDEIDIDGKIYAWMKVQPRLLCYIYQVSNSIFLFSDWTKSYRVPPQIVVFSCIALGRGQNRCPRKFAPPSIPLSGGENFLGLSPPLGISPLPLQECIPVTGFL